jgi:predicted enzyme related to lactoylglutathione lyase
MERATAFYVAALGATVAYATERWTSLFIARVRVGLFASPAFAGARVGLHFVVEDLAAACAAIEQAGGSIVAPRIEVAPDVIVADVKDSEGNVFSLRQA